MEATRALGALLLVFAGSASAQTRHPIEGVWSRVAAVSGGVAVSDQPGFRMFVDGHFSIVRVEGLSARVPVPAQGATAAQVRGAYQRFTGQAGRYEITSMQTVLEGLDVNFNPTSMGRDVYRSSLYRIVADTLWITPLLNQNGLIASPQTGRYVRAGQSVTTPLEGVWRFVETRAPDGVVTVDQPGYRMFKDGHFSWVRVGGTLQRPALPDSMGTAEQLMAVWGPFTAQHGTYEVSGQTVTYRMLVTKDPQAMAPGTFTTATYRMRGDSLWLSNTANQDGPLRNQATGLYLRVHSTP